MNAQPPYWRFSVQPTGAELRRAGELERLDENELAEGGELDLGGDLVVEVVAEQRRALAEERVGREHRRGERRARRRLVVADERRDVGDAVAQEPDRAVVAVAEQVATGEAGDLHQRRGDPDDEAKAERAGRHLALEAADDAQVRVLDREDPRVPGGVELDREGRRGDPRQRHGGDGAEVIGIDPGRQGADAVVAVDVWLHRAQAAQIDDPRLPAGLEVRRDQ